jgi:cell division initiation protein
LRITPLNIKKQEFKKSLRGFDTEEVLAFLEKIADEFETIQSENETLKRSLDEATTQLTEFRRIEKNLQDTLIKAQENSSKSIESAKKQTNLMMKEAELKAAQILEKSKEGADEIRNSIIKLREERDLIIARLKAIVSTQSQLLEIKVEKADNEPRPAGKQVQRKKVEIQIDDIIEKLL